MIPDLHNIALVRRRLLQYRISLPPKLSELFGCLHFFVDLPYETPLNLVARIVLLSCPINQKFSTACQYLQCSVVNYETIEQRKWMLMVGWDSSVRWVSEGCLKLQQPWYVRAIPSATISWLSRWNDDAKNLNLTHCGLVKSYGDRDLGQHGVR